MQKIMNWTAKRAGGRITIHGVEQGTGRPVRIVGVDEIKAGIYNADPGLRQSPVATTMYGEMFELV